MSEPTVRIGLPVWTWPGWRGRFVPANTAAGDFLRHYASVYDTVEGGSTFYRVPTPALVARWREATPPSFRFLFKLPRRVTHELALGAGALAETADFLRAVAPLEERLGPVMVQLPPAFGPEALPVMLRFLDGLSAEFSWAVEVRHPDLAADRPASARLDAELARRGMDRVWMDTRPLREAGAQDPRAAAAMGRKPHLAVSLDAVGLRPVLRYVGHPTVEANARWLKAWARHIARWVAEGREPYVFTHAPDETWAPDLARMLRVALQAHLPLPDERPWPASRPQPGEQLDLL